MYTMNLCLFPILYTCTDMQISSPSASYSIGEGGVGFSDSGRRQGHPCSSSTAISQFRFSSQALAEKGSSSSLWLSQGNEIMFLHSHRDTVSLSIRIPWDPSQSPKYQKGSRVTHLLKGIMHLREMGVLVEMGGHDLGQQCTEHVGEAEQDEATQNAQDR